MFNGSGKTCTSSSSRTLRHPIPRVKNYELAALHGAVEASFGRSVNYLRTVEVPAGRSVAVFDLGDTPDEKLCYAWLESAVAEGGNVVVMQESPQVRQPEDAVRLHYHIELR
jgi:hypothetical protein